MVHKVLRALAVVAGGAALVALTPATAQAACIEVDLAVHYAGGADYYPLGPDACVTDTPWNQTDALRYDNHFTAVPPGLPNGIYFEVWYTSP